MAVKNRKQQWRKRKKQLIKDFFCEKGMPSLGKKDYAYSKCVN